VDFEEFAELVKSRRAIRKFKPDPIPDEYVEKILDVARWAPSGGNAQPWEFIVVKDPEMKQKIEDLYLRLDHMRSQVWETTRREDLRHWAATMGKPNIAEAPVIIVPIGDLRTTYASVVAVHVLYHLRNLENMTNVTLLIHLAAVALGLGVQWVSIEEPSMGPFKNLLGIPEIYHIYSIVPMGYPAYQPSPAYRRELKEITHSDKYEMSKYRTDEQIIEYIATLRKTTRGMKNISLKDSGQAE